ncbi:MAG: hypothetical protein ACRDR6_06510 [Pseudonocardiaceae bacterium]
MSDVVRDVVADAAPEELPLVEGLSRFGDETAVRRLTRRSRPREPLGFGLDEIAVLVTPVVWIAVEEAVRRVVDSTVAGVAKGPWARLRRRLRWRPTPLTVPPLTREQIVEVRQRMLELAAHNGLERERAVTLADLLVARLLLHVPEESARASRSGTIGADPDTETRGTSAEG